MARIGDIVQKAFYLGIGAASLAADKAGTSLGELRKQAQKIADEMVERGEMTADEAKGFVNDMLKQNAAKASAEPTDTATTATETPPTSGPRTISIDDDSDASTDSSNTAIEVNHSERLRQEVSDLQAELERLRSQ